MTGNKPTGLGEPAMVGKRTLFQVPGPTREQKTELGPKISSPRFRTSIVLLPEALAVIENIRQKHRLETNKSIPMWKVVNRAVVAYGKKAGKRNEPTHQ
jgi:hypothetical protein